MAYYQNYDMAYGDRDYKHSTMVNHKGKVVAFAMDSERQIFYSVLELTSVDKGSNPLDVAGWDANPKMVYFGTEIVQVGYGILDPTPMPTVKKGGEEVEPGTILPGEKDVFLSSTARFTDNVQFQVLSDGTYIYIFRQSIEDGNKDMVYAKNADGTPVSHEGKLVPLVNRSLLVDRFVLVGTTLERKKEVRYQRSRNKYRGKSSKDGLGAQDLDGEPFYEPTQEVDFVQNLQDGSFSVVILPTDIADISRWQIFAQKADRMEMFNVERSSDGLFNTQGTLFYTSPEEEYQDSVFERKPGTCPFTQLDLIPIIHDSGYAVSALKFEASTCVSSSSTITVGKSFSVEFWTKRDYTISQARQQIIYTQGSLSIGFDEENRFFVSNSDKVKTTAYAYDDATWHHWAVVYDDKTKKLNILKEGALVVLGDDDDFSHEGFTGEFALGDKQGNESAFCGTIDEVRVWDRCRSEAEVKDDRSTRLVGNELGLLVYWEFDEGVGTSVGDSTNNLCYGNVTNGKWVKSDAPVGINPGIQRGSFDLIDLNFKSGPSAVLYYQQEIDGSSGYDNSEKPMKTNARVMLAVGAEGDTNTGIGVVDIGVTREGRLAQLPDKLTLPLLEQPAGSGGGPDKAAIAAKEAEIAECESNIQAGKSELDQIDKNVKAYKDSQTKKRNEISDLEKTKAKRQNLKYNLQIKTSNIKNAGTDADIYAQVTGTEGQTNEKLCDTKGVNDFTKNSLRWYEPSFSPQDVGRPTHITMKQKGNDMWICEYVKVQVVAWYDNKYNVVESKQIPFGNVRLEWAYKTVSTTSYFTFETRQDLQKKINKLNDEIDDLDDAIKKENDKIGPTQNSITENEKKKKQANEDLAILQCDYGISVAMAMESIYLDPFGFSVSGGLLVPAVTNDTPLLFDSAAGEVVLYYRGEDGIFSSMYLTAKIQKNSFKLGTITGGGGVYFVARTADMAMDESKITVALNSNNKELCTVTIDNTRMSESWIDVPVNAEQFANVINGTAHAKSYIGSYCVSVIEEQESEEGEISFPASLTDQQIVDDNATLLACSEENNTTFTNILNDNDQVEFHYTDDNWVENLYLPIANTVSPNSVVYVRSVARKDVNVYYKLEGEGAWHQIILKSGKNAIFLINNGSWISDTADAISEVCLMSLARSLRVGNTLAIGDVNVEVAEDIEKSDNPVTIKILPSYFKHKEEEAVYLIPYDYVGKSSSTELVSIPEKGSMLYRIYTSGVGASGNVEPGEAISIQKTVQCEWVPKTPGKMLYFTDGSDMYCPNIVEEEKLAKLIPDGDFTAEVWIKPSSVTGHHRVYSFYHNVSSALEIMKVNDTSYKCRLRAGKVWDCAVTLSVAEWNHFAVVYKQPYALSLSRSAKSLLSCGSNPTSNIVGDMTIEVFLKLNDTYAQGIMTKGKHVAGATDGCPYSFYIEEGGVLAFAFDDQDGKRHVVKHTESLFVHDSQEDLEVPPSLKAGEFYTIAVTREERQEEDKTSEQWITPSGVSIDITTSVTITNYIDIKFSIKGDGKNIDTIYTFKKTNSVLGSRDGALEIGTAYWENGKPMYFNGEISEVRLFNEARQKDLIGKSITSEESGLVSWWRFEEREGNVASDEMNNNNANIRSARWVKTGQSTSSYRQFYINGVPQDLTLYEANNFWTGTTHHFALGSYLCDSDNDDAATGNLSYRFCGTLDEFRLWKVCRTQEQIVDNMFGRLKGEKEYLRAYYILDANNNRYKDHSLLGNHMTVGDNSADRYLYSTAPLTDDIPQIDCVLGGVESMKYMEIDNRPAVQEYADTQFDGEGNVIGVHKRCYSVAIGGKWHLITGYKIGNLITEWVGQVQSDPQIIGYIEGAPPVPSENLTSTSMKLGEYEDYDACSSVEMEEVDTVNYIYASSKEKGIDKSLDTSVTGGIAYDKQYATGLGVMVGGSIASGDNRGGYASSLQFSSSNTEDSMDSQGRNTTKMSSCALKGAWEVKGSAINANVGRRFIPKNVGMALVQSDTMDIYALRLEHNHALLSYSVMPNPDIPKDWNIINFPLNPRYTKQGTLDGKVGAMTDGSVQCDENYPAASAYGEFSYFKPKEAYQLKQQITRQQEELETYYSEFDGTSDAPKKLSVRNLANTYVWTADGGFFSETSDAMESTQESTSGSMSSSEIGGGTFYSDSKIVFVAAGAEMSAMSGTHIESIKMKTKESEKTFSLAVETCPDNDLQVYCGDDEKESYTNQGYIVDGESNGVYEGDGITPLLRHGKVDAYRFMTFYLEPTKDNFEDFFNKVVDPIWIDQSNEPNAIALRQAKQVEKKPKCWRIMHRVTFVSRILKKLDGSTADIPEYNAAMDAAGVQSNYELLQKLDPFVSNQTDSYESFSEAVHSTLETYMPELLPYEDEILYYSSIYYGVYPDE